MGEGRLRDPPVRGAGYEPPHVRSREESQEVSKRWNWPRGRASFYNTLSRAVSSLASVGYWYASVTEGAKGGEMSWSDSMKTKHEERGRGRGRGRESS